MADEIASQQGLFGLGGRRLLVVEDNRGCAEAVRTWLEICGARVTVAGTIVEALRRMRAHSPDLMLIDVNLPDGTGWDLLERARDSVPGGAELPVVAITGMEGTAIEVAAREHGVRHLVTKPIAPEALANALSACLSKAA